MYASHYVIEEILKKGKNLDEFKEEFTKFSQRYPQDEDLQEIYQEFKKKPKELEKIKKKLESLKNIRKIDSQGGAKDLPYADRRHLSEEYEKA